MGRRLARVGLVNRASSSSSSSYPRLSNRSAPGPAGVDPDGDQDGGARPEPQGGDGGGALREPIRGSRVEGRAAELHHA
eukprot:5063247-Pyramimonas_sp.AAC.1